MTAAKVRYARCSTDKQDLEANRQILLQVGVSAELIYLDRGYSGTNRNRPGLDRALAAVRTGDTLVVPKLDRLGRSIPGARQIGDSLTARNIRLQLGTMIYDPADPMAKMFFNILATFAEFAVDPLRMRTPRRHGDLPCQGQTQRPGADAVHNPAGTPAQAARRQGTHHRRTGGAVRGVVPDVYRVLERASAATATADAA